MPSSLGPAEIIVILIVALIVLGPKRLPEAGRQVGKALGEIRRWSQDVKYEMNQAFNAEVVSDPTPLADPAPTTPATPATSTASTSAPSTPRAEDYPTPPESVVADPVDPVAAAAPVVRAAPVPPADPALVEAVEVVPVEGAPEPESSPPGAEAPADENRP